MHALENHLMWRAFHVQHTFVAQHARAVHVHDSAHEILQPRRIKGALGTIDETLDIVVVAMVVAMMMMVIAAVMAVAAVMVVVAVMTFLVVMVLAMVVAMPVAAMAVIMVVAMVMMVVVFAAQKIWINI